MAMELPVIRVATPSIPLHLPRECTYFSYKEQQEEGPGPKAKLSSPSVLFISSTNKDAPNLGISTLWGTSLPAVCNYTHR